MENPKDVRKLLESFDRALDEAKPEWPEEVKDKHPDEDDWGDLVDADDERGEDERDAAKYFASDEDEMGESTIKEGDDEVREYVDELRDIQDGLNELIDRLEMVIREALPGSSANLDAYLIAPLKIRAGSEQYMSNDPSIEKVIEMVQEEHGEGEEYDMDEGVGDGLDAMQKRSKEQGDELTDLKSKLDRLKGRVNSPEPGYDDRSQRGVKRVRR